MTRRSLAKRRIRAPTFIQRWPRSRSPPRVLRRKLSALLLLLIKQANGDDHLFELSKYANATARKTRRCVKVAAGTCPPTFRSQCGQDLWAWLYVFRHLKTGPMATTAKTFVEFGAKNGVYNSNTFFYETSLGWRGVLIEPSAREANALRTYRHCEYGSGGRRSHACLHGGVAQAASSNATLDFVGTTTKHRSVETIVTSRQPVGTKTVRALPLGKVLASLGVHEIDFLSADCEGCEADALASLRPWAHYAPRLLVVETSSFVPHDPRHAEEEAAVRQVLLASGVKYAELTPVVMRTASSDHQCPLDMFCWANRLDSWFLRADLLGWLPAPCLDMIAPGRGCQPRKGNDHRTSDFYGGLLAAGDGGPCSATGRWVPLSSESKATTN